MAAKNGGPFTVASVQAAPVFLDRDATIEKARNLINEAGKNRARLVVLPEAFVPAYPDWVWALQPGKHESLHRQLYGELLDQAVDIPDPATDRLCKAAKQAKAYVAIGVNERNSETSGASIYNTLLYIGADGEIMGKHRKLMPTLAERLVWAAGDGSTLETYDTDFGKLGGLLCWENRMPLARYAMYASGTQVYVAPTWDSSDSWIATLRHIATEGRCYVIGSCIAMRKDDIPDHYEFKAQYEEEQVWINRGNSAIVNPDGDIIAGPAVNEETILYADIDIAYLRGSKLWFDASGHYARPDVFQLTINREARPMMQTTDGTTNTIERKIAGSRPRRAG